MLFRFNIGKSRGGGIGFRSTLIYYMPFWDVARKEKYRVVYRPSGETFVHLAKLSLMAAFILACFVWYSGFPWSSGEVEQPQNDPAAAAAQRQAAQELARLAEQLQGNLPLGKRAELQHRRAVLRGQQQRATPPARTTSGVWGTIGSLLYWLLFVAVAAVAIVPIAGFPLQRITLERTDDDRLVIRKRGLWPSTRSWPLEAFGQLIYAVEEERTTYRYTTTTTGWLWMVKLQVSPQVIVEEGPSLVDDPEIVFHIDRQKERPVDMTRPPRSVRVLIKHLRRLTGIKQVGHKELVAEEKGFFTRRRKYVTQTTSTSAVRSGVYRSVEEAPEHLRDEVRRLMEDAEESGSSVSRTIRMRIRDSDGNERTYTSLDDMPPDVRERYEQAVRRARREKPDLS